MTVSLERPGYRLRERCWEALGEEPAWHEEVTGTCVPVQRVVERPRPGRAAEDTRMVSIMEEGLVEATRLLLKEALPLRTPRVATHQPQPMTLRNAAALAERFHHTEPEGDDSMAQTLVGLYNSLTDAQQVAQDLVAHDFSRRDIQVAVARREARDAEDPAIGHWMVADDSPDLVDQLVEGGVPRGEPSAYAEGIRRGGALVIVEARDDDADRGLAMMNRRQPIDIDERITQWQQEGGTGAASHAVSAPAAQVHAAARQGRQSDDRRLENHKEVTIPVVEEDLSVGKREVDRGRVGIHTRVQERPVEESVRLRAETVHVERRPVDRPATEADLTARQEETIEITETAEEVVVSKRARVVEEVVVRKEVEEHTEMVRETVRRTEVDVDQQAEEHLRTGQALTRRAAADLRTGAPPATPRDFSTYEAAYRRHHHATFVSHGAYADYEAAYRYGYELGTHERYRGRDWAALEVDARRDWEQHHPSTWERFKDAIRHAWEEVRGHREL